MKEKIPGEEKSLNTGAKAIIDRDERGNLTKVRPKSRKIQHKQHAFLLAMEKTFSNVSQAATLTGVERACHYDWMKKYPDYAAAVELIGKTLTYDFVYSKAMQRVNEGSDSMIQFLLRTKHKDQGFADNPANINVTINEVEIPDDEIPPDPNSANPT